jgi:hypothetical protein
MQRSSLGWLAVAGLSITAGLAVSAQRSPGTPGGMSDAARAFLASLDPAQRERASFPFNSDERQNFHFTPVVRKGLPLKDMNKSQRDAAFALLSASASGQGVEKAGAVRDLEMILKSVEMGKGPARDPEGYFFSVFGEPSNKGTWGWRYEGHHCALNWTIVNGKAIASSPQFYGANPAEVRVDVPGAPKRGTRVLAAEEDLARALVKSLTDEQRKVAVLDPAAPRDILTAEKRTVSILEDRGIAYSALTRDQKKMLDTLLAEYLAKQSEPLARERRSRMRKAGMDNVKFAWMGGLERGDGHYYRVQGSSFLVEYDNTQNGANHIHSVWRDFNGDWGMDLLAMHYRAVQHQVAQAR